MYSPAQQGAEIIFFSSGRKTNKVLAPKECIALAKARWFGAQSGRLLFLFSCAGKTTSASGLLFFLFLCWKTKCQDASRQMKRFLYPK